MLAWGKTFEARGKTFLAWGNGLETRGKTNRHCAWWR